MADCFRCFKNNPFPQKRKGGRKKIRIKTDFKKKKKLRVGLFFKRKNKICFFVVVNQIASVTRHDSLSADCPPLPTSNSAISLSWEIRRHQSLVYQRKPSLVMDKIQDEGVIVHLENLGNMVNCTYYQISKYMYICIQCINTNINHLLT